MNEKTFVIQDSCFILFCAIVCTVFKFVNEYQKQMVLILAEKHEIAIKCMIYIFFIKVF